MVQLLAKDKHSQSELLRYLKEKRNMDAYALTLSEQHSVKKAIIPVAGYGTRMYPATRILKKEFFPVVDRDGIAKPVILILLEELDRAGIEEFCLVINGDEDREQYRKFFEQALAEDFLEKLSPSMRSYEEFIRRIGKKIDYVVQKEKRGFGHAVYQCRHFVDGKPVLLVLGDTLYRTDNKKNCTDQLLDAFEKTKKTTVSIHPIATEEVIHYGVLTGEWIKTFSGSNMMEVRQFVEKPSVGYAKKHLGMATENNETVFYSVFGEYVLTPEVFEVLAEHVEKNRTAKGEIQLTDALDEVRKKSGLFGFAVDGTMFDVGIPQAYVKTTGNFAKK